MATVSTNTEAKILSRALDSAPLSISNVLAQFLLSLTLDPRDAQRADELAEKARQGELTVEEQSEIEEFRRVGRVIETLRLRAKLSMNRAG